MANYLTFARIIIIMPFVGLFFVNTDWNMKAAFVLFFLAAITDFLDGYIARQRGEETALGAALDPVADKLLVTAALILLARNGVIYGAHIIAVLIIVLREIWVSGLREALGTAGSTISVSMLAKWKTTAQLVAIGVLLFTAPNGFLAHSLNSLGVALLWTSAALTLWTGGAYTVQSIALLRNRA